MDRGLGLKFLVHLHRFASTVLQKDEAHEARKAKADRPALSPPGGDR